LTSLVRALAALWIPAAMWLLAACAQGSGPNVRDTGVPGQRDGGPGVDAGAGDRDTGPSPELDAGHDRDDGGVPREDAGLPPMIDAGTDAGPPPACRSDAECSDRMACNGVERCDPAVGCVPGTPIACDDGVACTMDRCEEPGGTCRHVPTDADGDGFPVAGCAGGRDCDDTNPAIRPGAIEVCNGLDDDCSGAPDDAPTMVCAAGSSRACTTGCGTTGTQACNDACSAYGPCSAPEACNGCDDDADTRVDETFTCAQGSSRSCTTMCGTTGTQTCNATCSGYSTCAASEVCNGCDDDADGRVDEGLSCGPPNDRCTGAIALSMSGQGTTVTGSTVGATNDSGCGTGGDVYYSFTLTRREVVYVHTHTAASYDTMLGIATGCTGTIACNDDSCGTMRSEIVRVLDPGTYYVVVSGFGGQTGTFTLRFEHLPTGNGTPVVLPRPASSATVSGTTSGSGTESSCAGEGPEILYYFTTCPSYGGGSFSATTCSRASWDTVLYFRDAASGAADVCNDDSCGWQSMISGTVSAGAGLRGLYIDGYWSTSAGSYSILYTMP
jgi:hypothetical protein